MANTTLGQMEQWLFQNIYSYSRSNYRHSRKIFIDHYAPISNIWPRLCLRNKLSDLIIRISMYTIARQGVTRHIPKQYVVSTPSTACPVICQWTLCHTAASVSALSLLLTRIWSGITRKRSPAQPACCINASHCMPGRDRFFTPHWTLSYNSLPTHPSSVVFTTH